MKKLSITDLARLLLNQRPGPERPIINQVTVTNLDDVETSNDLIDFENFKPKKGSILSNVLPDNLVMHAASGCLFITPTNPNYEGKDWEFIESACYQEGDARSNNMFFRLFILMLTYKKNPYYDKALLDKLISNLAPISKNISNTTASYNHTLQIVYMKELLKAYFSYKVSPNDYYCWPNEENKNSAIYDFFEQFYLNNINQICVDQMEITPERTYFIPTKRTMLLFFPIETYYPEIVRTKDPQKNICIPFSYDLENSWKDTYRYRISKNLELCLDKGKPWSIIKIENYLPDTLLIPVSKSTTDRIENYLASFAKQPLNFISLETLQERVSNVKDFPLLKNANKTDRVLPALRFETQRELVYLFTVMSQFFIDPSQESFFSNLLNNPEKIQQNPYYQYPGIREIFLKDDILYNLLGHIKIEVVDKLNVENFCYYYEMYIYNILAKMLNKPLILDKDKDLYAYLNRDSEE